ncbi:MAG: hypothetical protein KF906_10245 [Actinobacteria bacterium]|nr:hypothetical protein [Actinomycetota bacterium]
MATLIVRADLRDRSWRQPIPRQQLAERAYCFTDIFLGTVDMWFPRSFRQIGSGARTGVVGELWQISKVLATGEPGTWEGVDAGWTTMIETGRDSVIVRPPGEDPVEVALAVLDAAVAEAVRDTSEFLRHSAAGELPPMVAEMEAYGAALEG